VLINKYVPMPYFIFGVLTFGAFAAFATFFVMFWCGIVVMNPWISLVYMIGSAGLFATDIAAIYEIKFILNKAKKAYEDQLDYDYMAHTDIRR
jgi:hypothetical protein